MSDDIIHLNDYRETALEDIPVELTETFENYREVYEEALEALRQYQRVAMEIEKNRPNTKLTSPDADVEVDVTMQEVIQRGRLKLIQLLSLTAQTHEEE